jgi:superfamily I DNA and/or RNA helicase
MNSDYHERRLGEVVSGYVGFREQIIAIVGHPKEGETLVGLVRQLKERAEKAEKACAEMVEILHELSLEYDFSDADQDTTQYRALEILREKNPGKDYLPKSELKPVIDALNSIASWSEGEKVTTSFDEPASAEEARKALAFMMGRGWL